MIHVAREPLPRRCVDPLDVRKHLSLEWEVELIERAISNAGIGLRLDYDATAMATAIRPTHTWKGDRITIEIGGEVLELIQAPGESKDQVRKKCMITSTINKFEKKSSYHLSHKKRILFFELDFCHFCVFSRLFGCPRRNCFLVRIIFINPYPTFMLFEGPRVEMQCFGLKAWIL